METSKLTVSFDLLTNCHIEMSPVTDDVIIKPIEINQPSQLVMTIPILDITRFWYPSGNQVFNLPESWAKPLVTSINQSIPMYIFFNESSKTRLSVTLSELVHPVVAEIGVEEETGKLKLVYSFTHLTNNQLTIKVTTHEELFYQSVQLNSHWLEQFVGIQSLKKIPQAYLPVFSTWYACHQLISAGVIEQEVAYMPLYQLNTLIVDDGWQTTDQSRRYAYSGDWDVSEEKFPDMASHIKACQKLGMTYMLWISLPYVGIKTTAFQKFEDKLLYIDEYQQAGVLDPRYKDVRDYLLKKIEFLIKTFHLDGLKIDFIDEFKPMDVSTKGNNKQEGLLLEEAVGLLVHQIYNLCTTIKPDFLIEYRENYINPIVSQYAQIIRVKDCPEDRVRNRVSIINLRMLCPNKAVHSDMIMFHHDETNESLANYLQNCLFGVIQVSVKLSELSETHGKILAYWLNYQQKNAELLLYSPLYAHNPHYDYNQVSVSNDRLTIIVAYQEKTMIDLVFTEQQIDNHIVNATNSSVIYLRNPDHIERISVTTINCLGEVVQCRSMTLDYLTVIDVPISGLISIKKEQTING